MSLRAIFFTYTDDGYDKREVMLEALVYKLSASLTSTTPSSRFPHATDSRPFTPLAQLLFHERASTFIHQTPYHTVKTRLSRSWTAMARRVRPQDRGA